MALLNDEYLEELAAILPPLRITSIQYDDSTAIVVCEAVPNTPLLCPICDSVSIHKGYAKERSIRHLNFESLQVFITVRQPRIRCHSHGVHVAKNDLSDGWVRVTRDFEAEVLKSIMDSDVSKQNLARQLGLSARMLDRIVDRARQK